MKFLFLLYLCSNFVTATEKFTSVDSSKLGLLRFETVREQQEYVGKLFFREVLRGELRDSSFVVLPLPEEALTGIKMSLAVGHLLDLLESEYSSKKLSERELVDKYLYSKRVLAHSFLETNMFELAIEVYEELLVLTAGTSFEIEALSQKAQAHREMGEKDEELSLLKEASTHSSFFNAEDAIDIMNHLALQRKLAKRLAEQKLDDQAANAYALYFDKASQYQTYNYEMKQDLEIFKKVNHSVRAPLPNLDDLEKSATARGGLSAETISRIASPAKEKAHYEFQLDVIIANWRDM